MIGTTLSHYTILEELGRGGMGIVYKAEDTNLSRVVALKVLPTHLVSAEDQVRFRREAQSAASLNHPNIATIHDFGETDDGQAFLVMELIEGEPLSDRIGAGGLDAAAAVDFAKQIASGLQAAHKKGIVHRDVKPSNMMLTEDGRVKILDFGLAKMTGGVDITKTGLTVGTMSYMSPEQVQNDPVDERTDLWSLGVLFYEMLMGARPFEGVYDAAIIYGIVNQDVEFDDSRIPESLRPVLSRLLEKDREQRFASAGEVIAVLGGAGGESTASTGSVEQMRPKPVKVGTRRWLVPVTVAVAALLAVLLWRTVRPTSIPVVGVMYIDNVTSNERLGEQVGYLLFRNLVQAEGVEVVSRGTLADILRQQFGAEVQGIDASTAIPIARQAGISQMISGSATRPGAELVIDIELADVGSGVVIEAVSATAGSSADEDVFNAVNELTTGILRGLGVIEPDEIGPRVQNVMTESFSAYELYEKGLDEAANWLFDPAMDYFRQSIAIDSTFFSAYLQAVLTSSIFSSSPDDQLKEPLEFIRLAERNISHATEQERAILGVLEGLMTYSDGNGVADGFRALADAYPDDKRLQALAADYGPIDLTSPYLTRLFELDPTYADGYLTKAYMGILTGQDQEAVSAVRSYQSLLPEGDNSLDAAWEVMTGAGEEEEAITMLNHALENFSGDIYDHRYNRVRLAYTKAIAGDTTGMSAVIDSVYEHPPFSGYLGQFAESNIDLMLGRWDQALELSSENIRIIRPTAPEYRLLGMLRNHGAVLHALGRHDEAESVLEEVVETSRRVFEDEFNPYPVLAAYQNGLGYADALDKGKLVEAIQKIDDALKAPGMDGRHRAYRHLLAAHLSVLDGDAREAREHLDRMIETQKWTSHFFKLQAKILGLEGDIQGALGRYHIVEHNIAARTFRIAAYPSFFIDHAVFPYDVARMFDDLGDREEAVRRYEEALAEWTSTGADFTYVEIVRNRLRELTADS